MEDFDKLIVARGFKSCPKSNKSPNLVTLVVVLLPCTRPIFNLISKKSFSLHTLSLCHTAAAAAPFPGIAKIIFDFLITWRRKLFSSFSASTFARLFCRDMNCHHEVVRQECPTTNPSINHDGSNYQRRPPKTNLLLTKNWYVHDKVLNVNPLSFLNLPFSTLASDRYRLDR